MIKVDRSGLRFSLKVKGVELQGRVSRSYSTPSAGVRVHINPHPSRFCLEGEVYLGPLLVHLLLWRDPFRNMPEEDYDDPLDDDGDAYDDDGDGASF